MKKFSLLCNQLVWALLASVDAIGFHGLHFKGLEEPVWQGRRILEEKWIELSVDHFNHRDNRTWQMRYYEEDKYFNGSGPILIMLGGEWTISPGYLQTGLMHNIAKQHGALMYYTEHRYYGKSRPTQDMSTDNMQYLNTDQALADIAYFIDHRKSAKNIPDSKVIVFGGSYAGNMAAWIRIKYPHLVQGAVASSAPVHVKVHFYEYYEVVTNALRRHSEQCATDVKTAFAELNELIKSEGGLKKMKKLFNLCKSMSVKSSDDIGYFLNYLTEFFGGAVQSNKIGANGQSSIGKICNKMTNATLGEPIERLARIASSEKTCNDDNYSKLVEQLSIESWNNTFLRQWYYQTCTAYGYYQTADSPKSVFGNLPKLDFFTNSCADIFGQYYDKNLIYQSVNRTNIFYGARTPTVTNVIFVNGDLDPWHALSVLNDLNESSPAILISGSTHCQDLQPESSTDVPGLKEARKRISHYVSKWIRE